MLKVAILGNGNISEVHIRAWLQVPEAKITAICDVDEEHLRRAEEETGGKAYTSMDLMFEQEDLDIVDICLPTHLHTIAAIKAMDRGIHVLTEKPLSLHAEDIRNCYTKASEKDVRFMTAHVLRFWPEYGYLKESFDQGRYGALISANMARMGRTPRNSWDNWMLDEERSGLAPFDLHIHDLDFLIYSFGPPKRLQVNRAKGDKRDDIHVIYHYEDYFVSCQAAWFDANSYRFHSMYRYQFEQAVLEYEGGVLTVYHRDGSAETPHLGTTTRFEDMMVPTSDAYLNEIRYFTDCVLNGADCAIVKEQELICVLDTLGKLV